jgi:hypothetical protein
MVVAVQVAPLKLAPTKEIVTSTYILLVIAMRARYRYAISCMAYAAFLLNVSILVIFFC